MLARLRSYAIFAYCSFVVLTILIIKYLHRFNLQPKFENVTSRTRISFTSIDHRRSQTLSTGRSESLNRYVTFGRIFTDGRRIGNQLFNLAALLFVAEITDRKPAIQNKTTVNITKVEDVFELQISRFDDLCPCQDFVETKPLIYDRRIEQVASVLRDRKTITLIGYFQSWKYIRYIEKRLRQQLVFKREFRDFAQRFLSDSRPPNWLKNYITVGIHVRRGDVLDQRKITYGYTTPNASYFQRAMKYFIDLYKPPIQFIVVTNDMEWCREHFEEIENDFIANSFDVLVDGKDLLINVTYSDGHSYAEDLALLASCDYVIMSTGTFGWWAARLAKGTTVYYADWPRNGSILDSYFNRQE